MSDSVFVRRVSRRTALSALIPWCTVLYGYALAYLASPEIFASANVIELIHGLPEAVKYAGKVILAAPFSYHTFTVSGTWLGTPVAVRHFMLPPDSSN